MLSNGRSDGGKVKRIEPVDFGSNSPRMFNSVVLPQPLGPTTHTNSPNRTSRSTLCSASSVPRSRVRKVLDRPRTSITDGRESLANTKDWRCEDFDVGWPGQESALSHSFGKARVRVGLLVRGVAAFVGPY